MKKVKTPPVDPAVQFAKPIKTEDLRQAFPADVDDLLPAYDVIPVEFKDWNSHPMCKVARHWFMFGLNANVKFFLKPGIDGNLLLRHLQCCLRSWAPKHERKISGVAYLLSLWCDKVETYDNSKEAMEEYKKMHSLGVVKIEGCETAEEAMKHYKNTPPP